MHSKGDIFSRIKKDNNVTPTFCLYIYTEPNRQGRAMKLGEVSTHPSLNYPLRFTNSNAKLSIDDMNDILEIVKEIRGVCHESR